MPHILLRRPSVWIPSMRNLLRTPLGAGVLVLALCSPALAQPPAPASSDTDLQAQATQLYNEGTKAAKQNQWDKARNFYLSAWRVQQHWQIAANLGRAEFKTGKFRDAAEHLSFFLREATRLPDGDRKATEEMLDKARAKIGTLTITTNHDGAEIQLDGASIGTAPIKGEMFVEPGQHTVEARLDGYEPAEVTLDVGAGRQLPVKLVLAKAEPKNRETPVVCPPPPKPIEVPVGRSDGIVAAGFVIAGVTALAGSGFMIGAKVFYDKRTTATQESVYRTNESARQAFAIASLSSYLVAGAFGLGTLTYILASPSAKPKNSSRADLMLGPGIAGATVTVPW